MSEREALDRRAIEDIITRTRQLRLPLALRVARALAVTGDNHGGVDGEILRRKAIKLQQDLSGPEGD